MGQGGSGPPHSHWEADQTVSCFGDLVPVLRFLCPLSFVLVVHPKQSLLPTLRAALMTFPQSLSGLHEPPPEQK